MNGSLLKHYLSTNSLTNLSYLFCFLKSIQLSKVLQILVKTTKYILQHSMLMRNYTELSRGRRVVWLRGMILHCVSVFFPHIATQPSLHSKIISWGHANNAKPHGFAESGSITGPPDLSSCPRKNCVLFPLLCFDVHIVCIYL